jgi:hypothetical protein
MSRKSGLKRERQTALSVRSRADYPGARVVRVAVDDETWDAFRSMCGATPASQRLGELVAAEVELASSRVVEPPGALAAVRDIRRRVADLERLLLDR